MSATTATSTSLATPYRALILRMYRELSRYARIYPSERDILLGPFRASYDNLSQIEMTIATMQSRLSVLRMKTSKHQRPRPFTPPYTPSEKAPSPLSEEDMEYRGIRRYTYDPSTGRVETYEQQHQRPTIISNNQGITADQIKRHHELMERFRFRGRERMGNG